MDLAHFLATHPHLRIYEEATDQTAVLSFLADSPMRVGGLELTYDRRPNFQALLKCQSPQFVTIVGKDRGHPFYIFSLSVAKKWIHGRLESCAYIGDFRTDGSAKAAVSWRKSYAGVLTALRESEYLGRPRYVLTCILKKNQQAIRNLVETKRDFGVRYDFIADREMINIFARLPWCRRSKIVTTACMAKDRDELRAFLDSRERKKLFGANFSHFSASNEGRDQQNEAPDEWSWRSDVWRGFSTENFLIQKDSQGRIVACLLPWDPSFAKRITVTRTSFTSKLLLKGLALFRMPLPKLHESLRILYLTHLNLAEQDPQGSLYSFLDHVKRERRGYQMISFAADRSFPMLSQGFIAQRIMVSLFSVALKGDPPLLSQGKLKSGAVDLGFEMGLV